MHTRLPTLEEAAPAGVVLRGKTKLRVQNRRGARRWRLEELRGSIGVILMGFHSANVTEEIRFDFSRLYICFQDIRHQGH